jgi:deoxyhypusine monooxygenase
MDLPPVYVLEEVLLNREEPIAKRMRALFYLRTIGTEEVIPVLCKAFSDPSLLLQHEICYVLGQINLKESISFLVSVLKDESIAGISRHEAAEAIAAIGDQDSISLLRQYENDKEEILADTCRLAIKRIEWLQTNEE